MTLIQSNANPSSTLSGIGKAILWGGVVAGLLDATDGVIAFAFKGMNPFQVLQYIASGLQGPSAMNGGFPSVLLGLGMHFAISFTVAAIFVVAATKLTALRMTPMMWGLIYGAAVYLTMTFVVLPQTPVIKTELDIPYFLNGILGHALFVGVPIAWSAQRWLNKGA